MTRHSPPGPATSYDSTDGTRPVERQRRGTMTSTTNRYSERLSPEEVTAAFKSRSFWAYSSIRTAAAVVGARGSPQTLDGINACVCPL